MAHLRTLASCCGEYKTFQQRDEPRILICVPSLSTLDLLSFLFLKWSILVSVFVVEHYLLLFNSFLLPHRATRVIIFPHLPKAFSWRTIRLRNDQSISLMYSSPKIVISIQNVKLIHIPPYLLFPSNPPTWCSVEALFPRFCTSYNVIVRLGPPGKLLI
jgi:hypothetical protein